MQDLAHAWSEARLTRKVGVVALALAAASATGVAIYSFLLPVTG